MAGSAGQEIEENAADVIEKLGVGPFLLKEAILGGGYQVAGGTQLIIISCITWVIAHQWQLNAWERGATVSVIFFGKMLGNIAAGPCCDMVGRRLPIVVAYALLSVFSVAAAFSIDIWTLCASRFVLGFAMGTAQTAWTAMQTEICPSAWRMAFFVSAGSLWIVGEACGGLLVWQSDPQLKNIDWPRITLIGAIPAFVLGTLAALFLKESASWLALQGQKDKAKEVLQSIQYWNSKEHVSVDFASVSPLASRAITVVAEVVEFAPITPLSTRATGIDVVVGEQTCWDQVHIVFAPTLCYTTLVLCFSCFTYNFVYYGGFYAFPLVLGDVNMGVSPAAALALGVLWEVPGFFAAAFCSSLFTRRVSIIAYLVLMACATLMFIWGADAQKVDPNNSFAYYTVQVGYGGMKCVVSMGSLLVYQYLAEVYPTSARAAGTGLCIGCGRFGSIVVPFAFEAASDMTTHGWHKFFHIMASLCVVNAILVCFLPFETWGMTLKDHLHEIGEAEPLSNYCVARKTHV